MEIIDCVLNFLKKDAKRALKRDEIPVSAVITDSDGNVISCASNNRQKSCDVLGHAEILAIKKAEKKIKDWRLTGYKMFVTLEPCNMCSVIIKECRLDHVYYFLPKKGDNIKDILDINKSQIEGYEEAKRYFNDLLTFFFENRR